MLTQSLNSRFLQAGVSKYTSHTTNHLPSQIESVINKAFAAIDALSGTVLIQRTAGQMIITLPFYTLKNSVPFPFPLYPYPSLKIGNRGSGQGNKDDIINTLGQQLALMVQCSVELRLVRLMSPYLDASLMAKFISRNLQSSRFRTVVLSLFTHIGPIKPHINLSSPYTGAIIGIKVRLAGRLLKEASRPRQTIKTASIGSFASNNLHTLQSSSYTATNAKGTYTVKVWLCIKA